MSAPPTRRIQWHGIVGETAVKLLDMVALSEQTLWFLTRGKWHVQVADQAAAACPLKEGAHGPAGGSAVGQPPVQIGLGKVAQVLAALIQPGPIVLAARMRARAKSADPR